MLCGRVPLTNFTAVARFGGPRAAHSFRRDSRENRKKNSNNNYNYNYNTRKYSSCEMQCCEQLNQTKPNQTRPRPYLSHVVGEAGIVARYNHGCRLVHRNLSRKRRSTAMMIMSEAKHHRRTHHRSGPPTHHPIASTPPREIEIHSQTNVMTRMNRDAEKYQC